MFFTYSQNNSGGFYKGPAEFVIVEANSAFDADRIAENHAGLYFDGTLTGIDCACCGSRWYRQGDDSEGTENPEIYGEGIFAQADKWYRDRSVLIVYLSGAEALVKTTGKDRGNAVR